MRKKRSYKKYREPDPKYDRVDLGRFINAVMEDGKRTLAERIVYRALETIEKNTKENPVAVFEKAIENASPQLEVVSRRVGGANYQVPQDVRPERRFTLAVRWIVGAARGGKGRQMAVKLADEIVAAAKNEGAAIKKKQDMHRMAEANRAFAHFARARITNA